CCASEASATLASPPFGREYGCRDVSDAAAVVLALATAGGAWAARPVPLILPLGLVALALAGRWPVVLCVGAALLASTLAARSWQGLQPPASGPWSGGGGRVARCHASPTHFAARSSVARRRCHRPRACSSPASCSATTAVNRRKWSTTSAAPA